MAKKISRCHKPLVEMFNSSYNLSTTLVFRMPFENGEEFDITWEVYESGEIIQTSQSLNMEDVFILHVKEVPDEEEPE